MKKIFLTTMLSLTLFSCDKEKTAEPKSEGKVAPLGIRDFQVDEDKVGFTVILTGVFLGSPDSERIWSVITRASTDGKIDHIAAFGSLIEGGIAHCIEVLDPKNRAEILEDLKTATTSLDETNYQIKSINSCELVKGQM